MTLSCHRTFLNAAVRHPLALTAADLTVRDIRGHWSQIVPSPVAAASFVRRISQVGVVEILLLPRKTMTPVHVLKAQIVDHFPSHLNGRRVRGFRWRLCNNRGGAWRLANATSLMIKAL